MSIKCVKFVLVSLSAPFLGLPIKYALSINTIFFIKDKHQRQKFNISVHNDKMIIVRRCRFFKFSKQSGVYSGPPPRDVSRAKRWDLISQQSLSAAK